MSTIKVAILGFGTVGEGVYQTVKTHQVELAASLGKKVEVVAVLVKNKSKYQKLSKETLVTDDFKDILHLKQLDVVVEAIVGCEPAYTYLRQVIEKGCSIVTANKEMFAYHGDTLKKLAEENQVSIGFEATVGGGIPIIQVIQQLLNVNRIEKLEGILNGTSNYILSEMRTNQLSFAKALAAAQTKGYAEADPTNDIEGYDAFYKLMILSELVFGEMPDWNQVVREGIQTITSEEIAAVDKVGLRFKLVASIQRVGGNLIGSVRPTLVDHAHPLYSIEGAENSLAIEADLVGRISLQGPGAGKLPTASAIVEDLIHVVRGTKGKVNQVAIPKEVDVDRAQRKQNWLVINPEILSLTTPHFLEGTTIENHLFIQADEQTISQVRKQNPAARIFEVLAEQDQWSKLEEAVL